MKENIVVDVNLVIRRAKVISYITLAFLVSLFFIFFITSFNFIKSLHSAIAVVGILLFLAVIFSLIGGVGFCFYTFVKWQLRKW